MPLSMYEVFKKFKAAGFTSAEMEVIIPFLKNVTGNQNTPAASANLVHNGNFSNNAEGWSLGAGWSYVNSALHYTADGNQMSATGTLTTGLAMANDSGAAKVYKFICTLTGENGGVTVWLSDATSRFDIDASTTLVWYFVSTDAVDTDIQITPWEDFDGGVTVLSVQEVADDVAAAEQVLNAKGISISDAAAAASNAQTTASNAAAAASNAQTTASNAAAAASNAQTTAAGTTKNIGMNYIDATDTNDPDSAKIYSNDNTLNNHSFGSVDLTDVKYRGYIFRSKVTMMASSFGNYNDFKLLAGTNYLPNPQTGALERLSPPGINEITIRRALFSMNAGTAVLIAVNGIFAGTNNNGVALTCVKQAVGRYAITMPAGYSQTNNSAGSHGHSYALYPMCVMSYSLNVKVVFGWAGAATLVILFYDGSSLSDNPINTAEFLFEGLFADV